MPTATAQQVNQQGQPGMEIDAIFAGSLRDTIIQHLRDPTNGTIRYIYLPMTAPHTPPGQSGYVQYGPNSIGSISCVPRTAASRRTDRVPSPGPAE